MNKSITKKLRSTVSVSLGTTEIAWVEINGIRYMNTDYPYSLDDVGIVKLGDLGNNTKTGG